MAVGDGVAVGTGVGGTGVGGTGVDVGDGVAVGTGVGGTGVDVGDGVAVGTGVGGTGVDVGDGVAVGTDVGGTGVGGIGVEIGVGTGTDVAVGGEGTGVYLSRLSTHPVAATRTIPSANSAGLDANSPLREISRASPIIIPLLLVDCREVAKE
jgi:hypothetical protein